MGQHWEIDEILDRALQEDDLERMDAVIARLVAEERISRSAMLRAVARRRASGSRSSRTCDRVRAVGEQQAPPTARHRRQATRRSSPRPRGKAASTRSPCRPTGRTTARSCRPSRSGYGLKITNDNPNGVVGRAEPKPCHRRKETHAHRRCRRRRPGIRDHGCEGGSVRAVQEVRRRQGRSPRLMKDSHGLAGTATTGARSRSATTRSW